MPLPPKTCPECEEEYLHTATVCVHCDVPLVLSSDLEQQRPEALPPPEQLRCIRVASTAWAVGLSERLREAGIPHRVEPLAAPEAAARRGPHGAASCGVFVLPQDAERAGEIDARYLETQLPDLGEAPGEGAAAGDGCPACGEPLAADASECPGCGLAFAGED